MKTGFLALLCGCFLHVSGGLVFPANGLVSTNNCTLPNNPPGEVTVTLGTTSGSTTVFGLVERGSFLLEKLYSVVAVPGGADLNIGIVPGTKFNRGHNKAYIGFFTGNSVVLQGFVTIDVNCVPQSTISLKTEIVDQPIAAGSGPMNILLPGEIKGANPGDVSGLTNNPPTNIIRFTMTPDTGASTSPWITSASVPGSAPNTGTVTVNGAQDLTVSVNPAGLSAQPDPYLGYVHIRDSDTGFGSADLTVRLALSSAGTGNVTMPHFAVNGPYITGFYIVNTGPQFGSYTLNFLDDNGQPLAIPVQGQGTTSTVSGPLPGNGSLYIEAGDANRQLVGGSVRVTADASIAVQALFRLHIQDSQGNKYYEAAVPSSVGSREFIIPFDATKFAATGEQLLTGIAIANMDAALSNVTCIARDSSNAVIANAVNVPQLQPNGHWADFDFKPLLNKRGTIDCSANTTIAAMALHAFERGAISSLPVLIK